MKLISGPFKFYIPNEESLILAAFLLSLHANCFEILKTLVNDNQIVRSFYNVENLDDVLSNIRSDHNLVKVIRLALKMNETEIAVRATEDLIE
jgi:hypothetical protein